MGKAMDCVFDLTEQPCVLCGKPSGGLGTCRDRIFCPKCKQECMELNDDEPDSRKLFIDLAEKTPYLHSEVDEVARDTEDQ